MLKLSSFLCGAVTLIAAHTLAAQAPDTTSDHGRWGRVYAGASAVTGMAVFYAATHHGNGGAAQSRMFSPEHPASTPNVLPGDTQQQQLPGIDDPGPVTTTPEPTTLALTATGLVSLVGAARRRRKTQR